MNLSLDTGFFTTLLPFIIQMDVEEARKLDGYVVPITLPVPNIVITMVLPRNLVVDYWDKNYVEIIDLSTSSNGKRTIKAIVKHPTLQKIILDYANSTLI